jgi:hypothetical protein
MLFERLTVSANGGTGIYTEADSVVLNCLVTSNRLAGINSVGGQIIDYNVIAKNLVTGSLANKLFGFPGPQ